jgi:hypothetical protein
VAFLDVAEAIGPSSFPPWLLSYPLGGYFWSQSSAVKWVRFDESMVEVPRGPGGSPGWLLTAKWQNARLVAPGICVLQPDLMIAGWEN